MAKLAGCLFALIALAPASAAARAGWDCSFEGAGNAPALTITHLDVRGRELLEPHWPATVAYRILVDTRDILVAARAYDVPPTYRSDARGAGIVLILNKRDGHIRRATSVMGEPYDRIETGSCGPR